MVSAFSSSVFSASEFADEDLTSLWPAFASPGGEAALLIATPQVANHPATLLTSPEASFEVCLVTT